MTVYVEYAFAENFLLDGLLLFLALKCARAKVSLWRLMLAAAVGGGEAVLFPLLMLPAWASYLVKFLGGALLAVLVVSKGNAKTYLVAISAFFAMTFLLGGLLTALYSFFDLPYIEGEGYLIESAPVALVLAGAGIFAVLTVYAAKYFYRYRKLRQSLFSCRVSAGESVVLWRGLADSGNCLYFRGEPVCVISAIAALALFRGAKPVGRMSLSTVAGSRDSPVFVANRLEVEGKAFQNVYFTVGEVDSKDYRIILHTAFTEGRDANLNLVEEMAQTARGK